MVEMWWTYNYVKEAKEILKWAYSFYFNIDDSTNVYNIGYCLKFKPYAIQVNKPNFYFISTYS